VQLARAFRSFTRSSNFSAARLLANRRRRLRPFSSRQRTLYGRPFDPFGARSTLTLSSTSTHALSERSSLTGRRASSGFALPPEDDRLAAPRARRRRPWS
jgi:hypothetical protein